MAPTANPCLYAVHMGIRLEDPPYPQPVSLSTALLAAQLLVLGSMLASMSEANQLSILNVRVAVCCRVLVIVAPVAWLLRSYDLPASAQQGAAADCSSHAAKPALP